jgi:hypothetical protein
MKPGRTRRVRTPPYRAVLAEKTFRGSLEEVMQQIDAALGSQPTARIPVPFSEPPVKKKAAKTAARKSGNAAPKKKSKAAKKKPGKRRTSRSK